MDTIDPTFLGTLTLAGGIAVAMFVLGAKTKMLELRDQDTRCPSCRRLVRRGRVCACAQ
jgi:hypothetical protein